jgi:hypothetical protein
MYKVKKISIYRYQSLTSLNSYKNHVLFIIIRREH